MIASELEGLGFTIAAGGTGDIAETLKATIPQYSQVIADAGIKIK